MSVSACVDAERKEKDTEIVSTAPSTGGRCKSEWNVLGSVGGSVGAVGAVGAENALPGTMQLLVATASQSSAAQLARDVLWMRCA